MAKKVLSAQDEQFKNDCLVINFTYEYPGYTGKERYGIITALSEKELLEKYGDRIKRYHPYMLIPNECREAIHDHQKNAWKHHKHAVINTDCFNYHDELTPLFHHELFYNDKSIAEVDEGQSEEEYRMWQLTLLNEAMMELTEIQRRRVKAAFFDKKSQRQIAEEEGVNYSKVNKSITQALKKMKKYLESRGCKLRFCSE